jgi:hypothetical protein
VFSVSSAIITSTNETCQFLHLIKIVFTAPAKRGHHPGPPVPTHSGAEDKTSTGNEDSQ